MNESIENMLNQHVYCTKCSYFRLDDEDRPYCYHENECNIGNCEDSMSLGCRPCYIQREERWRMLIPCLIARHRKIENLAVGFYECGPYEDSEEIEFALKVQRISDIEILVGE